MRAANWGLDNRVSESGLVNAPTGFGKTFSIFLAAVIDWINHNPGYASGKAKQGGTIKIAVDADCDLVVVGNRGMSGMRRFVLGSVPNKLSHQCGTNLLIIDTSPARS